MLFFVDVAKIVACFVSYAVSSIAGAKAYDACSDDLTWYESPVACIMDWAAAEGFAILAYADCLSF